MEPTIRDFRVASDLRHQVGECPTWDDRNGRLLWTSIIDGQIHALTLATGEKRVWQFDGTVGSFGLCRSGRLVVALKSELVLFDPDNGSVTPLGRVDHAVPQMRLNDGKVGPDGAFWVGSMDDRPVKEPVGRLYRVDPNGRVDIVVDGVKVANGLAWDRAGTTMYFADSRGPWVDKWRFDPATGEATGRSRFLEPDEAMGRPDGGACDSDDCTGRLPLPPAGSTGSRRLASCWNGCRRRMSGRRCPASAAPG